MTLFYILHIAICIFMVIVILLQPGKADTGIGFGSSSQSIFGSKGAGNFLTRLTSACALGFLATSFYLTLDRVHANKGIEIKDEPAPAAASPSPTPSPAASPAPAAPTKAEPAKAVPKK